MAQIRRLNPHRAANGQFLWLKKENVMQIAHAAKKQSVARREVPSWQPPQMPHPQESRHLAS
jgi:hypothetical protein